MTLYLLDTDCLSHSHCYNSYHQPASAGFPAGQLGQSVQDWLQGTLYDLGRFSVLPLNGFSRKAVG